MRYAYYPGCSLHSSAKDYDVSTRAICRSLGIELSEIPGWVCCGASAAHMTSQLLSLALPVKNLVLASASGLEVAVACAACYNRLKVANTVMQSGADEQRVGAVDQVVGSPYRGQVAIKHLIEILVRDYGLAELAKRVTRPLTGLKVASYYGCLLVRPATVAFDNPENPTLMDQLAAALGAEIVAWPYKTECCGSSLSLSRSDIVLKLCRDILTVARDQGADCLVVGCPLCQANLDMRQVQINAHYKMDLHLPILYFSQVVGLALGLSAKELGLAGLMVSPDKLLKARVLA